MDRLGQYLIGRGEVTSEAFLRAERVGAQSGMRTAITLSRLGLATDSSIAAAFAEIVDLSVLPRSQVSIEAETVDAINPRFLQRVSCMPIGIRNDRLRLAMADPEDEQARLAIEFATGLPVDPVIATFSDIEEVLAERTTADDALTGGTSSADDIDRLLDGSSDAPVVRLVQRLLGSAIRQRASDVHIEPMARHLSVRYRIDGRLSEVERHPSDWAEPVTSRIKVMAGLDIAEQRLPQDGRLRLTVAGQDVDVRVSTSPIAHGESVVLRLLGRSEVPLDLERLGLSPASLARLTAALDRPHGIVLLTGPTGSGKTTTLYAALARLRRPEVKILTVEDPVEMLLDGINQVQVRPEIELSYAATLRAFLRQDPDILMIGEIRDGETAEIALRAALTGHLVLSTLHTNSALGAFTRLADIGVEPYLAASTVIATAAQRLIRALCPHCATARAIAADERALFEACEVAPPATLHDPVGCGECQQSGYRGRLPLIEVITIDGTLRDAIRRGEAESWVPPYPKSETLLGHGLLLAAEGRTSLAEVRRAIQLA